MDPATIALITALAVTTTELLKRLPKADEKLRTRCAEMDRLFVKELAKPKDKWDADLLLNLRDEAVVVNKQVVAEAKK